MTGGRRLLMLSVDDERGASTRYRVLAHRPALERAGYQIDVRYPMRPAAPGAARLAWRAADMMRDVLGPNSADVLMIHRKMYPPWLAPMWRHFAGPRVYDMDDAVDLPPPSAPAPDVRRYRRNFEATVEAMDLVLCGNRHLAERLPHGRYELLPTPIDTARFQPRDDVEERPPRALGWVGHSDNLPYLEALADPLRALSARFPGLRLIVVADRPPALAGVDVEFRRWSLESEVSCFDGIEIGLMPLEDTPWARGKCSFKAIQYMALGIPAVASPVGMNRVVIEDGESGFLPSDAREWTEALACLLTDGELSRRIGLAGRRRVEETYSLDVVSRRLVSILDELVEHHRPVACLGRRRVALDDVPPLVRRDLLFPVAVQSLERLANRRRIVGWRDDPAPALAHQLGGHVGLGSQREDRPAGGEVGEELAGVVALAARAWNDEQSTAASPSIASASG